MKPSLQFVTKLKQYFKQTKREQGREEMSDDVKDESEVLAAARGRQS